jgi:hypothetical protein
MRLKGITDMDINKIARVLGADVGLDWGYTVDGWSESDLDETGLMEVLEKIEALAHEIRVGRRGSYANIGDTIEDLASHIEDISIDLVGIADGIRSRSTE